jgi:hypothetical protein
MIVPDRDGCELVSMRSTPLLWLFITFHDRYTADDNGGYNVDMGIPSSSTCLCDDSDNGGHAYDADR